MDKPIRQIYRFEDVEIDVSRGHLKRGGEEFRLRSKTFQVLAYLIERCGTDVGKADLIRDVWKDTAVVDDVLVQSIKDIRRALGDDRRNPHFIRTIPKFGYRFIGEHSAPIQTTPLVIAGTEKISFPRVRSALRHRAVLISIMVLIFISLIAASIGQNSWQTKAGDIGTQTAAASNKRAIAIVPFKNLSGESRLDWLREGLPDMFISELSHSNDLNVLTRDHLDLFKNVSPDDLSEITTMARQNGAQMFLTGSFAALGEKIRIEVQLYDAATGQLNAAESLTVDHPEEILTQIDLLSLKLAQRLNSAGEDVHLAEIMTNDLEAYRCYSLGVEKAADLHNKEAIELLEKAVKLDPQFAMAQARIGHTYAVKWDYPEKAKPYLERAFQLSDRLSEKDRLNIAAWYAIANMDFENAIEQYRQIIARYPLEIEGYERLARLLRGEERRDEAIRVLTRGLEVSPTAKHLYNQLGGALSMAGRHDEAIAAHRRFVELSPNEPNAYDSLGLTYQWMGDYRSAIENYNRALEIDPKFDVALVHLANATYQTGRYREAIGLYRRYMENAQSDSERRRALGYIAEVYLRKRDLRSAGKITRELLKVRNDLPVLFLNARVNQDPAGFRELSEKTASVPVQINRGAKSSPRFSLYVRGYAAVKTGQTDDAIRSSRDALRYDPPVWDIDILEDSLGESYLELDRPQEAAAEFERILQSNPNYPLASFHLAQAYEKLGESDKARQAYLQFLETWKDADQDIPEIVSARNALAPN